MLRNIRSAIPDEERHRMDAEILRNFTASEVFQEADTLLLFIAYGSEPDTLGILRAAWNDGKKTAVPKCGENGSMEFRLIRSLEELSPGAYGIPEPTTTEQPLLTEKTLCLVPGIAFTYEGCRMGQGGGYYDRFLEKHGSLQTVGICYSCLMQQELPCEAHDRRVQAVVTEKSMEVCHGTEF